MTASIYEHIRAHLREDGTLDEVGVALPDEAEPVPGGLRWAPGAMEGVLGHHHAGSGSTDGRATNVAGLWMEACRRPSKRNRRKLYNVLSDGDVLDLVDPMLDSLAQLQPDRTALHDVARWLVTTASDRRVVKAGIVVLGATGLGPDGEIVRTLGAHEEFTLWAATAITKGLPDPERELWALARTVEGWGRIHCVEHLRNTHDPEIQEWILREGFRNRIMHEYLAYTAATTGRLLDALHRDAVDRGLLTAAGEILEALIRGGPAEDLDWYDDGADSIEAYLALVRTRAETLQDFHTVAAIESFLAEDSGWDERGQRGWTATRRRTFKNACEGILAGDQWVDLIQAGLQSDDHYEFYRADAAARRRGIDTFELHLARIHEDPLAQSGFHWGCAWDQADHQRAERLVDLVRALLSNEHTPTGPSPDPDRKTLTWTLGYLADHPGVGGDLIRIGLAHPDRRDRYGALSALKGWPRATWPEATADLLESVVTSDPDHAARELAAVLIAGRPPVPNHRALGIADEDIGLVVDAIGSQTAWMADGDARWVRWVDPSGAAVVAVEDATGDGVLKWGLADATTVRLTEPRLTGTARGGRVLLGRASESEADSVELPVLLHGPQPVLPASGDTTNVRVVGLCRWAAVWADEPTYRASQPPDRSTTTLWSLVPCRYGSGVDSDGERCCEVLLTGVVTAVEERTNELTGRRFVRTEVRIGDLVLAVTFAEEYLAEPLAPGAVVQGAFDLVGCTGPGVRPQGFEDPSGGVVVHREVFGWRVTPRHLLVLEVRDGEVHLTRTPLGSSVPDRAVRLPGRPRFWDASEHLVALQLDDHLQLLDDQLDQCAIRPAEEAWQVDGLVAGGQAAYVLATRPRQQTTPGVITIEFDDGVRSSAPFWAEDGDARIERITPGGDGDYSIQLDELVDCGGPLDGQRTRSLHPAERDRAGVVALLSTSHEGRAVQLVVHLGQRGPARVGEWLPPPWLVREVRAGTAVIRGTTESVLFDDLIWLGGHPPDQRRHRACDGLVHETADGTLVVAWSGDDMQVGQRQPDGTTHVAWVEGGSAAWCGVADDGDGTVWVSTDGSRVKRRWPLLVADRSGMWQVAQLEPGSKVVAAGAGVVYLAEGTGRYLLDSGSVGELPVGGEAGVEMFQIRAVTGTSAP